ncbi:hypothetical protein ACPXA0_26275, partial [Escherichia coli]|uniref:hypothetical protein n=1 Tax=Escherichia coli TaxID=562 RepID=UPI003CE5570D
ICMRQRGAIDELAFDVAGGADALWVPLETVRSGELVREDFAGIPFGVEPTDVPSAKDFSGELLPASSELLLAADPVGWRT